METPGVINPHTTTPLQKICRKASSLKNHPCQVKWLMQQISLAISHLLHCYPVGMISQNEWWETFKVFKIKLNWNFFFLDTNKKYQVFNLKKIIWKIVIPKFDRAKILERYPEGLLKLSLIYKISLILIITLFFVTICC